MRSEDLMRRIHAVLVATGVGFSGVNAVEPPQVGERVLFMGDSITAHGGYVNEIETTWILREGAERPDWVNLGLGSETVSGLSEPHHPFPRPDAHDRLDAVLGATEPDVVVACYGMNDGIYHPPSPERLEAYQRGVGLLITKVLASGARLFLLSPPPYAGAVSQAKGPEDGVDFGYKTPYEDYDEVLQEYAAWVTTLDSIPNVTTIDVRSPVVAHLDACFGRDPIHPNDFGHRLMGEAILTQWGWGDWIANDGERDTDRWRELFGLVRDRRNARDRVWLWEIGHTRPGRRPATTWEAAQQKAAEIEAAIVDASQD